MHTAYPTSAELRRHLEAAGLTVTEPLAGLLAGEVVAARRDFELAVGRRMLAVTATRTYDPPTGQNGELSFGVDLAAAPSSVTVAGVAYTLGADYRLLQVERDGDLRPYWGIRFRRRWAAPLAWTEEQSVSITGLWGFGEQLPEDAWSGILARAAWKLWGSAVQAETEGLKSWREKDRGEDYSGTWERLRDQWGGADGEGGVYGAAVRNYQRWSP